jgi:hypothetical protein
VSTYLAIALAVFVVAVVAGIAVAAVRGLALWRTFKRFRRTVLAGAEEMNRRVALLQRRADSLPAKAERLDEARASLEHSLAEVRVITGAFGEVAAVFHAARTFVGLR